MHACVVMHACVIIVHNFLSVVMHGLVKGLLKDSYDFVTRVIQLISPSQSCDNLLYILVPLSGFK